MRDFAAAPEAKFGVKADTEQALRSVVEYQLYVDLQRGWRVTMPNLEQTGLLKVNYRDLAEIAADEDSWARTYLLDQVSPAQREELGRILLDDLRRVRAIDVDCLSEEGFERLRSRSRQLLIEPWAMSEDERLVEVGYAAPRPSRAGGRRGALAMTGRGGFGRYLKSAAAGLPAPVAIDDATRVITDLFHVLTDAGLLARTDDETGPAYRLRASALRWHGGDGQSGASDRCGGCSRAKRPPGSTPSSATSTRTWPASSPACTPASTPPRSRNPSAWNARRRSDPGTCRCCTAPPPWSWVSTSPA
jgi:hypothetical protein